MATIFKELEERDITIQAFEKMVMEASGIRIPFQTMRYWRAGNSHPKVTEVDAMAKALGYELELMLITVIPSKT